MDATRAIKVGSGGHKNVPDHWISPTSLRPIILGDNCLLWLKHFGRQHGFEEDPQKDSLLDFITRQGQRFEAKWISELAPEAVAASESDVAVRRYGSFLKTVELMARRTPVIAKAAMWSDEHGIVGSCDVIALASWLRKRFPDLAPCLGDAQKDYYCVLDMKNQRGVSTHAKRTDLRLASTQVSLYTRALGDIQNHAPSHAFLVTPDHLFSPLPVPVEGRLGDPLPTEVADMIRLHNRIKKDGASLRPWKDEIVAPNWRNEKDAPWSGAKKRILHEFMDHRPLEMLPGVGKVQAEALRAAGFSCADDLLTKGARHFDFTTVKGLKGATARRIEAVLTANSAGKNTTPEVSADLVPPRTDVELYVDYEFITPIQVDIEKDWPKLRGRELIFMIGVGWEEQGQWRFEKFTAHDDTPEAEKEMLEKFIAFLRNKGVVFGSMQEATTCPAGTASLYHWSPAEVSASRRAAQRTGIEVLADLPWVDLATSFKNGPIVLPGQWDFSIKSVSKALGKMAPEYATAYPKNLAAGADAMVLALNAFERGGNVANCDEFKTIAAYLEVDCENLCQILRWLRASVSSGSESSSPRAVKGRAAAATVNPGGWYRCSLALMAAGQDFICPTIRPFKKIAGLEVKPESISCP